MFYWCVKEGTKSLCFQDKIPMGRSHRSYTMGHKRGLGQKHEWSWGLAYRFKVVPTGGELRRMLGNLTLPLFLPLSYLTSFCIFSLPFNLITSAETFCFPSANINHLGSLPLDCSWSSHECKYLGSTYDIMWVFLLVLSFPLSINLGKLVCTSLKFKLLLYRLEEPSSPYIPKVLNVSLRHSIPVLSCTNPQSRRRKRTIRVLHCRNFNTGFMSSTGM